MKLNHWDRRVLELAAKNKESVTDEELFTSEVYKNYTRESALNTISGVGPYLRRQGFRVSDKEVEKRMRGMTLDLDYNPQSNNTACTNGSNVYINAGTNLVSAYDTREEKHYAIQGMRVHEQGHMLYTDFPTRSAWLARLEVGDWWPCEPQGLQGKSGALLKTKLADKKYREYVVTVARELENSLEDGYIEREMVAMYPGDVRQMLATINLPMVENAPRLGDDIEKLKAAGKMDKIFPVLLSQILLYSKFDKMEFGDYDGEYRDLLESCCEIIDDSKYERDPKKRIMCVNELLCMLGEHLDGFAKAKEKKGMPNSSSSSSGEGGGGTGEGNEKDSKSSGTSGGGNGTGEGGSGMTDSQLDALKEAIEKAAEKVGKTQMPQNLNSRSLANPGTPDNKGSGAQGKVNKPTGSQGGRGAKDGVFDATPAKLSIDSLLEKVAKEQAQTQAEAERAQDIQKEASEIMQDSNRKVEVMRAESVGEDNRQAYEVAASELLPISRSLQQHIMRVLKARKNDGKLTNLPMGRRLEARTIVHGDGKYFSKNRAPSHTPKLYVSLLIDESGSMSGQGEAAARRTAIVVEDFCRKMDVPHTIMGYTTGREYGSCLLLSYAEPEKIDGNDRYRVTGISSRGGTPTYPALKYTLSRAYMRSEDTRIVIVVSDGGSDSSGQKNENGVPVLQALVKDAKKRGVIVIAAGIGSSRKDVEAEFPGNFLNISDMALLPQTMCQIIKKEMLRW